MKGDIVKVVFNDQIRITDGERENIEDLEPIPLKLYGEVIKENKDYIIVLSFDHDNPHTLIGFEPKNAGWLILKSTIVEMTILKPSKSKK